MGSHTRPNWSPEEIARLKTLCESGKYSFVQLAQLMKRPMRGVMYKCYEQKFRNPYRARLYTYNENFFGQITPETCYWAGVITTDGCIAPRRSTVTISLNAAAKDYDHIARFKAATNATQPIGRGWGKCNLSTRDKEKLHEHLYIRFEGAKQWQRDLESNFNITPHKTFRSEPPCLPTLSHELCFMRGFIDGDGYITLSLQPGSMTVGFCGGNRAMIANMKRIVDKMNLPQFDRGRESQLYQPDNESECHYFQVRGFRAAVLFEILQRLDLPRLSRKWDNPHILEQQNYWKKRPEIWPDETFFAQYQLPTQVIPIQSVVSQLDLVSA